MRQFFTNPKPTSLQKTLSHWILLAASVFTLLGVGLTGAVTFYQAQEFQDNILREIAVLIKDGQIPHTPQSALETDVEDEVIQVFDLALASNLPGFPNELEDGLHTRNLADEEWRFLTVTRSDGSRYAIAQQTELRDNLAWSSCLTVFLPLMLLMGLMFLIIPLIIRSQFRSLSTLSKTLHAQDGNPPGHIPTEDAPEEMVPFITAINDLFQRIRVTMQKQNRFIADAAHELRTPLAALSLQADNLGHPQAEADRATRQAQLQDGLSRLRKLVIQLLDLAALQSDRTGLQKRVSFNQIVREVIADLYPLAETRSIDLGVVEQESLSVLDMDNRLRQLVQNAISNALQYTPQNGTVDIRLRAEDGNAVLSVEDTGPGIPPAQLGDVMQPFYRVGASEVPGEGLGLAISNEIAAKLGGQIELSNRPQGGFCFRYRQPML